MDPAFNYSRALNEVYQLLQKQRAGATSVDQMAEYQRQSQEAMRQLQQAKAGRAPLIESTAGYDNAQAQASGALPTAPTTQGLVQKVAGKSNLFGAAGNGGATPLQPDAPKIETPKLAAATTRATGLIQRKM